MLTANETASRSVVGMGQILIVRSPNTLSAILGSCVGVVLHHPRMQAGAMAHVVLPESMGRSGAKGKFADSAINEMVRLLAVEGIPVGGLVAKITGGANMFGTQTGPMQIGEHNIAAVRKALAAAHIRIVADDVGGSKGRRVHFDPYSGNVEVDSVGSDKVVL